MEMEIRQPKPEEQPAMRELAVLSFNVPIAWARGGAGPTAKPVCRLPRTGV